MLSYKKLEPTEEVIKSGVVESDAAHADEAGLRVMKFQIWN